MPLTGDNLGSVIASLGARERSPPLISQLSEQQGVRQQALLLPTCLWPLPSLGQHFPAMQEPEMA